MKLLQEAMMDKVYRILSVTKDKLLLLLEGTNIYQCTEDLEITYWYSGNEDVVTILQSSYWVSEYEGYMVLRDVVLDGPDITLVHPKNTKLVEILSTQDLIVPVYQMDTKLYALYEDNLFLLSEDAEGILCTLVEGTIVVMKGQECIVKFREILGMRDEKTGKTELLQVHREI